MSFDMLCADNDDYDFVDDVPDHLFRMICTKVLREPLQRLCCRKHFCRSCLIKWFDSCIIENSCPHCRSTLAPSRYSCDQFYDEISKLKVKCIHWKKKGVSGLESF